MHLIEVWLFLKIVYFIRELDLCSEPSDFLTENYLVVF